MQVPSGEMKNDAQIVIRVPQEMAERLKDYAAKLEAEYGIPVSVAVATRKLLDTALETAGHAASGDGTKVKRKR